MEKGAAQQPIIIKKKKGHGHGHHGGSWKVALADFMTAMMAFFLLMWLMGSTTKEERRAIAGYFQDPASQYIVGEGGADLGIINQDEPLKQSPVDEDNDNEADPQKGDVSDAALQREIERVEKEQLEELKKQLEKEINSIDSVFKEIKDQILIDFTALGLRIQIVDKDQRPMFDVGSANLKPYSTEVLYALAEILDKVQNKISITGHTDATPYGTGATYTNWELSADRANAARRALIAGKYPENKVATVQGMGSVAPFLVDKPTEPINRRIAIIVLKKAVADALMSGSGIDGQNLLQGGINSSFPTVQPPKPQQKILTPAEVDAAIDAGAQ